MLLAYEDALRIILDSCNPLSGSGEAYVLGTPGPVRVLGDPILAIDPHPRFDNSSVDGYACHAQDLQRVGERLTVSMTVAAGAEPACDLLPGTVARIFTGAKLPSGTAAVAMQEDVQIVAGEVILGEPLAQGQGFRCVGADFVPGDELVAAGTPISPGVAGLLASQGVLRPRVYRTPTCLVLTTGDEIVPPEAQPGPNELRDSIGSMLGLALGPYASPKWDFVPDDSARLSASLLRAAREHDAVFVAGGASVGDRDFVARIVAELGNVWFHGINVRPGKPLLFGTVEGTPVLGLPGNPASAYVCFHLFGLPLLKRLGGWSEPESLWFSAPFDAEHEVEPRDVFARVTLAGGQAMPIHEQASFGLRSLGKAQALARLPGEATIKRGDLVEITLL